MRETDAPCSGGTCTLQSGERPSLTTKARTLKRWLLFVARSTTCTSQSGDGLLGSVASLILSAGSNRLAGALRSSEGSAGRATVAALLAAAEAALTFADMVGGTSDIWRIVSATSRDSNVMMRRRGPDSPRPINCPTRIEC